MWVMKAWSTIWISPKQDPGGMFSFCFSKEMDKQSNYTAIKPNNLGRIRSGRGRRVRGDQIQVVEFINQSNYKAKCSKI